MTEIELSFPTQIDFALATQIIENCCATEGLINTLKDSLKKYPGCIHWHFKKEQQPGVLEITLWPKGGRLWFKIQSRRRAFRSPSSWIRMNILKQTSK